MGLFIFIWLGCGIIGAMIAQSKNRSPFAGGLAGFFFGPIGVFVLACLSKVDPDKQVSHRSFRMTTDGSSPSPKPPGKFGSSSSLFGFLTR